MTKTLKKSFIVILMLVTSLFFGFAFGAANSASAAELNADEIKFINNVNAFIEKADTDDNDVLSIEEIKAVKGDKEADSYFLSMYTFISNSDTNNEDSAYITAKNQYNVILGQYNVNGAVDFYSTLATSIRKIYKQSGSSYKQHKVVESARAEATKFAGTGYEKDLAFLKNVDLPLGVNSSGKEDFEDLLKAETQIAIWKTNIENAITAIKAIQVYVVKDPVVDTLITVWDNGTSAYLTTYEVLWGSKNSVETARIAAEIVIAQDDVMFINGTSSDISDLNHYKVLTTAETALKDLEKSVNDVVALIKNAYNQYSTVSGSEVCYTIYESLIKPANDAYVALPGADYNNNTVDDNLNNLQAGVGAGNIDNLNAMLSTYATVQNKISGVNTKINAINTVNYNNDSKKLIKEARNAFEALPNDVKVNDNGEWNKFVADKTYTAKYCVKNYGTLKEAEATWKKYEDEVKELIDSIKGLRTIEVNKPATIYVEFGNTQELYNGLSDKANQLKGDSANEIVGVNDALLDEGFKPEGYLDEILNCKDAYEYYQKLANDINTATKDIIKNITTLYEYYNGLVRFTNDFDNTYTAIVNALNDLPKVDGVLDPRYKGAINNYSTFEPMQTAYSALISAAETWIESIVATVSVNTFDAVETSNTNFAEIIAKYLQNTKVNPQLYIESDLRGDLNSFSRVYEGKLYSAYYNEYVATVSKKAEIIGKLDEIKSAVAEGTLVRPTPENALDPFVGNSVYADAVSAVTTKFNGLSTYDDTSVEGYITTANYFKTNENYSASYALYKAALINVQAHVIEEAIAKISNKSNDNTDYITQARTAYEADVATGSVYTKEEVQFAVRNFDDVLVAAENAVKNFVNGVKALLNGAAYDGSDVTAVDTAVIDDNTLILGIYKLNVDTATGLKQDYNGFSNVYRAYAATDYVVADAITLLNSIINRVGDKSQGKIKYIDDQLLSFINQYTAGTNEVGRYETLDTFVKKLTSTQQALLDHLGSFQQIQRDKVVAEELGKAIEKLANEVAANKITNETVIDYYVINSIFENMNPSQKALVSNINEKTPTEALAEIKTRIDTAVSSDKVIDIADKLSELESAKSTLNGNVESINATIVTLKATLTSLESTVGANSTVIANIKDQIAALQSAKTEIETKINNIESDIATIKSNISSIKDAYVAADNAIKTAYEAADNQIKADYKKADGDLQTMIDAITKTDGTLDQMKAAIENAYTIAIATEKTERENAINSLQKALTDALDAEAEARESADAAINNAINELKNALKAETEARENAIKAEQEARAEEIKSLNNAIVTITIIFSIVLVALVACVVVLFLKARKA